MTRLNLTLDCPSPLLSYTPSSLWRAGSQSTDANWQSYSGGTFQVSTGPPGAVSWTFNGTGIWIYGAKRGNHGFYNVTLDNGKTESFDGYASPDEFQALLYGAANLALDSHTITVVNAGPIVTNHTDRVYFDIDWITWETEMAGPGGPTGAEITIQTFDDTHPRFEYLPSASSWHSRGVSSGDTNTTSTTTSSSDGVVELTFDGDAVALYGSMDTDHGEYTANIDGGIQSLYSGKYAFKTSNQTLFYVDGLGVGTHTLRIANKPSSSSETDFSVDYAQVWTAKGGSPAPGQDSPGSHPHDKSSTHIGPIIGGIIGAIALLSLIAGFFFVRRRRRQTAPNPTHVAEPYTVGLGRDNSTPLYYTSNTYLSNPPTPSKGDTRHAYNQSVESDVSTTSTSERHLLPSEGHGYGMNGEIVPLAESLRSFDPPSTEGGMSFQDQHAIELSRQNMTVPQRPEGFGQVGDGGGFGLPPNYNQAVEPWRENTPRP